MKQSRTASGSASKESQPKTTAGLKFKTVDEYFSSLPAKIKNAAKELRTTIRQIAPEAKEVISYNIPAFKLNGISLVWYASWKEHISLYPRSAKMEAAIKELANYEGGKGTIKFPADQPLPLDLIKKIVKFKMAENLEAIKLKKKK